MLISVAIVPGTPQQRRLQARQTHVYAVTLTAGDFLRAVVAPHGIDVAATVIDPDGHDLLQVDLMSDPESPETILIVAPVSGCYRLAIKPAADSPSADKIPPGRYTLTLTDQHPATPTDIARVAAMRDLEAGMAASRTDAAGQRQALDRFEAARAGFHYTGDRAGEARALMQLASSGYALFKPDVLDRAQQALALFRDLGDRVGTSSALNQIALVQLRRGEIPAAIDAAAQALDIARASGNRSREALTRNILGMLYGKTGEAESAVVEFRRALRLARMLQTRSLELRILNNLGIATKDLGDYQMSLAYDRQTLALARKMGRDGEEARVSVLNNMGNLYRLLGEPRKALPCHEEALTLARARGDADQEARALNTIGATYYRLGEFRTALDYHEQSLAVRQRAPNPASQASTLDGAGRARQRLGDFDRAFDDLSEALRLRRTIAERYAEADSLLHLAQLERDRARLPAARQDIEAAVDLTDSLRGRVMSPDLRASFVAAEQERYETSIDILMQLDAQDPTAGYARRALESSERARARVLLESLLDTHPTPAPQAPASPLTVDDIQHELVDADTILLEFALGEQRSWLWVVTSSAVTAIALPPRGELESRARHIAALLTARQPRLGESEAARATRVARADAQWPVASADFSRLLVGPIATRMGNDWKGKRLVIVADGALACVPFGALPDPVSVSSGHRRPLMQTHEIANVPSASVLALMRRETRDRAPAARSLAILADPVFDAGDPRVNAHPSSGATMRPVAFVERALRNTGDGHDRLGSRLPRLPFSRQEAHAIAALVPARERLEATDFRASRAVALNGGLADYRVVHFATHGILNSEHPELSGLVLSLVTPEGAAQDGFLRLEDIYHLRLSADLVVLSACRTALGRDIRGEGLIGLTRGFMHAGARRVVASLWQVDDLATAELMRLFYKGMLKDGLRPAAALRAAQQTLSTQSRWSSPYFWSAFVLQGEWR